MQWGAASEQLTTAVGSIQSPSKGRFEEETCPHSSASGEFRAFQHKEPSVVGRSDRGFREMGWLMDRGINSPRTLPV
jgi:hypothetical protein